MGYNKAKAEKEWLRWKNKEENQLRSLGMEEDAIQKLHAYDWNIFKAERNYSCHHGYEDNLIETGTSDTYEHPLLVAQDLLDVIENMHLYNVLKSTNEKTLTILLLKMKGLKSKEIAPLVGLTSNAVDFRIWHLKKKLKNIF